ncbi:hypothetical protein ABZ297_45030 [Nonomuraea sp. NPDC005983]|uniref:hypothetical protein n=1 Tax=Nonomuraea sp. NPDC005983 TaxID=3155595 RepID=UPI0033B03785
MRAFSELCDRAVALLVPQLKAAAASCWTEWNDMPQQCYKRLCCTYSTGTRCNGWVRCF